MEGRLNGEVDTLLDRAREREKTAASLDGDAWVGASGVEGVVGRWTNTEVYPSAVRSN